ncbi:MAG: SGNH/GDSL hydrolase family protein [Hyphomicrobiales bacterium]|nr:SGNH/GDSL hydrolase family protein [Hyphomicrobiales bacterium]MBV8664721.1 SGNH/GDSL hydrolase family protein [Hyphomicrobiales bacterium]
MAVIVAFGDSNTWGYDPATATRFPPDVRWTGVMQRELGPGHRVIEEGLNGRTTVFDDPIEPGRRGADYLPPCLRSHAPLDLLILALGCNDMKLRFSASPTDIANGAELLIRLARAEALGPDGAPPRIVLVAPPPIGKLSNFAEMFAGGTEKSRVLAQRYRDVAERQQVGFVDAGQLIVCSDLDGIHFDADAHALLGQAMAEAARMVLA